jgi:transposase
MWQGDMFAFLHEPGAPLENNVAERALKLAIRQRTNSLFYATEHSASRWTRLDPCKKKGLG